MVVASCVERSRNRQDATSNLSKADSISETRMEATPVKVIVPQDHGATDVLHEEERAVVVRPHDYPEDTYPALWFYFQIHNDTGHDLGWAQVRVENLPTGADSYEPFWKHCLWSRDGEAWERIPDEAQRFGETTLTVEVPLRAGESLWVAETFPLPYGEGSVHRASTYLRLCAECAAPPASGLSIERLRVGESARGRPLYAFRICREERPAPQNLLVVAGQHAVEQSGKIFAETVLRGYHGGRFAGTDMETLLQSHNVVVVPLANPDGCYDGRMNTNAEGIIMDAPSDNSVETRAMLALIEETAPRALINCHGWGNRIGAPPHEDLYRWTDDDPLFAYLRAHVPGCSTSGSPHWLADNFRLESHARERFGTECVITELNWNCYLPPDGGPPRLPTRAEIEARAVEYFMAIARFCAERP